MIPLYDTLHSRRLPIVNWILIGLNLLVFFYELSLSPSALDRLMRIWDSSPRNLWRIQRRYGSLFLRRCSCTAAGFHILSNMWVLFIFGDNVEDRMGGGRYLMFYLLSGVAAALMESFVLQTATCP